jgi:hypothetical protein
MLAGLAFGLIPLYHQCKTCNKSCVGLLLHIYIMVLLALAGLGLPARNPQGMYDSLAQC